MATDPPGPDPDRPVVEPSPAGDQQQAPRSALDLRIRQQELLAELGVVALKRIDLAELLSSTVRIAAEGLDAELCKILQYFPADNRFLLVAGVGWDPGLVGTATVGADLESPSGYALKTGRPVISNHLEHEERFRTPDLLRAHGVRRAINVILQGDGAPFGVLEVDGRSPGEFSEYDIAFLQGAANILGMAIERQRYERDLRGALEHQKVLVGEINHRVKNSLQLVASLFSLQAAATDDVGLAQSLQEAVARVGAVARIHERLYRSPDVATVDLSAYLADVCSDLATLAPQHELIYRQDQPIAMATDRAVRVALLVAELVTNAAKHAYPESTRGRIVVQLARPNLDSIALSVRDEGQGLPDGNAVTDAKSLGMKIIRALLSQMGAELEVRAAQPGTEFILCIPVNAAL
jgi:two-component sensor histidine kinase